MASTIYIIGFLLLEGAAAWTVDIIPDISVHMNQIISVPFSIHNTTLSDPRAWTVGADQHIAIPSFHVTTSNKTSFNGILNISGIFLGRTKLTFTLTEMAVSKHSILLLYF